VVGTLLVALPLFAGVSLEPGLVGQPIPLTWTRLWTGSQFIDGSFALRIDALSIVVSLTAIVAGLFIHIYAALHTTDETSRHVTLALLNGVLAALLILVLADNLFFLLLGWSLTGWCTYGLLNRERDQSALRPSPPTLHVLGDACMLLAIAVASRLFASLWIHDIITGTSSTIIEELLPNADIIVSILLVTSAAVRTMAFPFQAWATGGGKGYARATAHALTSALPSIYMLARVYPFIAQTPPAQSLLSWWGVITTLLTALVALFQPGIRHTARAIASAQAGLLLLGLGSGAYAVVFSFLPAFVLLHTLFQLMTEEMPSIEPKRGRRHAQGTSTLPRWILIFSLAAATGLPLLPGFTFYTQLAEWLVYKNTALWILTMLSTPLLAASASRTLFSLSAQPKTERAPGTGVLSILAYGIAILGVANLASPSPLGRFLVPIFGSAGYLPPWGWFAITVLTTGLGIGLGYVLAKQQKAPSVGIAQWIAKDYRIKDLYDAVIARPLLAAGRFIAESIEPGATSWTFGALARLMHRETSENGTQDSVSLSLFLYLLGTAAIAAYLLFQ
jgi:NADH-quinone oxidoreductase subunit L